MKMANIDAVFDYNFTYPKTTDGVSDIYHYYNNIFMLHCRALLWLEPNCCTLQTSVLVLVAFLNMFYGEESGTLKDLD